MAEALGVVGSITGIVAFGLKSATIIQTYIDAVKDANQNLQNLVVEVKNTASTLEQLDALIERDSVLGIATGEASDNNGDKRRIATTRVINDEGVKHATILASQCKRAYTAILNLIAKDIGASQDENGEMCLDNLDADNMKVPTHRKLKLPLREARVTKLRQDFAGLKLNLLLHLCVMQLATLKIRSPPNSQDAEANQQAKENELKEVKAELAKYVERIHQPITGEPQSGPPDPKRRRRGSMSSTRASIRQKTPVISSGDDASQRDSAASLEVEVQPPPDMSIYEKKPPTDSGKGKEIDNSSPVRPDLAQREKATAAQALVSFKTLESVPPGTESGLVPETSLLEPEHFEDEQPPGPDTGTRLPEATKRSPQSWPKSAFRSLIKRKRKKSHIGHKPKTNDLEAYAIEDSRKGHGRKLPFSHQEITRALSDARKSSQASVLDQYLSLDANKRHMVDDLIENVSRFQPRTLVALNIRSSGTSTPTLIVFLARGSRVEPVRIEYADQWSELPYESCLSWDEMKLHIQQAFGTTEDFCSAIQKDQYQLIGSNGSSILPTTWMSHVKPGLTIGLKMTEFSYPTYLTYPTYPNHLPYPTYQTTTAQYSHSSVLQPPETSFLHSAMESGNTLFSFSSEGNSSSETAIPFNLPSGMQLWPGSEFFSEEKHDDVCEIESDEEEIVGAEDSIIDVEAAQSIANLDIDGLLRRWTNVAEVPPSHDDGDDDDDSDSDDSKDDDDDDDDDDDAAGLVTAVVSN